MSNSKEGSGDIGEEIDISILSKLIDKDLKLKKKLTEEYWNSNAKNISKKLSFHNELIFGVVDKKDKSNTRILTNSLQNTLIKLKSNKKIKKIQGKKIQITRKIRIYPNEMQKLLFSKYFNAYNYIYNKTVEEINLNYNIYKENKERDELIQRIRESERMDECEDYTKIRKARIAEINHNSSEYSIRSRVVINKPLLCLEDGNLWLKEIQSSSKQISTVKAFDAKNSNLELIKSRYNKYFKLGFRSKKYSDNIFYIEKKALVNGSIFPQQLRRNNKIENYDFSKLFSKRKNQNIILSSEGEFAIKEEKDGRYYICVTIKPVDKVLEHTDKICALDPGVRTFQTMYSEDTIGEYGFNTSKTLYKLYKREDRLKSILEKGIFTNKKCTQGRTKYKLKKRCALLRTKIKYIVQDLHWKTANHLTNTFQVILLPVFNTKQMANKKKRKISKTTTRLMLGLSHYEFQQKLLYKANARGRTVILCKEHYTSKCCGKCGTLNQKLGSSKIFHCSNCDLTMDRDIHAARNILIRNLAISSLDSV